MNTGLYIAMNGASYNLNAQTVHSNNLANASTTGFKADLVSAFSQQLVAQNGVEQGGLPVIFKSSVDFSAGSMQQTGDDFDIAIDGDGWIAVLSPDGREGYSRGGRLRTDSLGFLINEKGYQVLGTGGPIVIPESETVEIANDGTITVRGLGQGPQTLQQVERIQLVNPDLERLQRGEDGVFYANGEEAVVFDPFVRLRNGFVESSNVNAINELTSVTSHARQFEMNFQMMQTLGDLSQTSAELLRVQV